MGIYLGDTKITGTGVQIDNTLSSTSTKAVTNAAITEALSQVGYIEWQKPDNWVDIRSGAVSNSVYFLVAHSVPVLSEGSYTVSTYPQFAVKTTISNSGTYDVFVDGVNVATTNSGSNTVIDWATLYNNGTLIGGYDVTYPSTLTTHIVRVAPTSSSNTITAIQCGGLGLGLTLGILWAHFTTQTAINASNIFNFVGTLEAVTCAGESLKVSNLENAFRFCGGLKNLCKLEGSGSLVAGDAAFRAVTLRNIKFKNIQFSSSGGMFQDCERLEKIECDNSSVKVAGTLLSSAYSLKELPVFSDTMTSQDVYPLFNYAKNLKDTVLDLSQAKQITRLGIYGSASNFITGLKGLMVSNEAPFSHATSPQLNVSYTGLSRMALVNLFHSLPTVSASQVCNVTGATGANDLTAEDLAIATSRGWTITR